MQLPLDMMVMRELRVLLTALCSSSKAVIISSIWACFPRLAESGWVLGLPILVPAELVPAAHLCMVSVVPSAAGLLFRIQFFRYWLGFSAADISGDADEWLRWRWGLKNPAIKKKELSDHLDLVAGSCKVACGPDISKSLLSDTDFKFRRGKDVQGHVRISDVSACTQPPCQYACTHILMGFHWITGCYGITMALNLIIVNFVN